MTSKSPSPGSREVPGPVARLIGELRRRKVIGTAGVYLFGAFVTMQVANDVVPYLPFVDDPERAGQVILLFLIGAFPVVLVLAWVLELTPPQIRRERPVDETGHEARAEASEERPLRSDTVGVLPFVNLSDDPEDAYFSDGITDDIMMSLCQIPGLRVLPRTTVGQYKGVSRRTSEIAAELGAATLVTGTVRRAGPRVRVVVSAVDARTDVQVWGESYDRELTDIFEVQSDIATRVGGAVARELSPARQKRIEERGTNDPEAYDLYLRARYLWNQRTETAVSQSVGYFQRALERDSGFALAYSGLADAHVTLGMYGARAPLDVMHLAKEASDRAVELDETMGEAVATRGVVSALFDWKWEEAGADFRRAIALTPSYATAYQWHATTVLAPTGRFEEAKERLLEAMDLDPASDAIAASCGVVSYYARDYHLALEEIERVKRRSPNFPLTHYFEGLCREALGDSAAAVEAHRTAVRLSAESSEMLAALGHALGRAGSEEEASAILARLEARADQSYVSQVLRAQVLLGLGRDGEAIERLRLALDDRATDLAWIGARATYDPLRAHDGFQEITRTIGVAPGQTA